MWLRAHELAANNKTTTNTNSKWVCSNLLLLSLLLILIAANSCALCSRTMKKSLLSLKLLTRAHDFAEHILRTDLWLHLFPGSLICHIKLPVRQRFDLYGGFNFHTVRSSISQAVWIWQWHILVLLYSQSQGNDILNHRADPCREGGKDECDENLPNNNIGITPPGLILTFIIRFSWQFRCN